MTVEVGIPAKVGCDNVMEAPGVYAITVVPDSTPGQFTTIPTVTVPLAAPTAMVLLPARVKALDVVVPVAPVPYVFK